LVALDVGESGQHVVEAMDNHSWTILDRVRFERADIRLRLA